MLDSRKAKPCPHGGANLNKDTVMETKAHEQCHIYIQKSIVWPLKINIFWKIPSASCSYGTIGHNYGII